MVTVRPGTGEAMALGALVLVLALALGGLQSSEIGRPEAIPFSQVLLSTLCFQGGALVFVHLFLWVSGETWSKAFGLRVPRLGRVIGMSAGLTVLALPGVWALRALSAWGMSWLQLQPEVQQAVAALQQAADPLQLVVVSGMAVLLAPAAEETLFRGVLYAAAKRWFGTVGAAVLTALLFAASHGNLAAFVPLFFLGLLWTWLYERTGSLIAPVVGHMAFNLVNVVFLLTGLGSS